MEQEQQAQPAPTLEQVEQQLNGLILQRAGLKDQLDELEKQMPIVFGVTQVLRAQKADQERLIAAAAEAVKED